MTKNVSASVHARLLNRAREKGLLFNELLQHFALERWLYRLSRSNFSNRLILKGGLLLVARDFPISRSTRDVDLLADLSNDLEAVRETIAEICGAGPWGYASLPRLLQERSTWAQASLPSKARVTFPNGHAKTRVSQAHQGGARIRRTGP
jgi:hypothetical protein